MLYTSNTKFRQSSTDEFSDLQFIEYRKLKGDVDKIGYLFG
jgi:hypothetical protein